VKQQVDRASRWIYTGIWAALVNWFRVPERPPELPGGSADSARSFRPAEGFLRYLKFYFWFGLVVIDGLILLGWIAITIAIPWLGIALAIPALAVAILPDIVVYIAIHLRYDTTWYVVSDRSLRIRRGIWLLHETTITYENIQNIRVTQGPIQRLFGIADVLVDTAGGGGGSSGEHGGTALLMHRGLIEGVDNAHEIRDLILAHLRKTRTAGLGDDHTDDLGHDRAYGLVDSANSKHPAPGWTPEQLTLLREIRSVARALAGAP
jgi:membrane protein YdbS with pleckstrin-like domain